MLRSEYIWTDANNGTVINMRTALRKLAISSKKKKTVTKNIKKWKVLYLKGKSGPRERINRSIIGQVKGKPRRRGLYGSAE